MIKVTLWGTRGSIATPGPETVRYGGNTACVEVRGPQSTVLVIDAGTGIRRLGHALNASFKRVDLLLTHLHMDHIQGLGFFAPLYNPGVEVHIWGPASPTLDLRTRLTRYMSPPLFPVRLRDLPCKLTLHEVPCDEVSIGEFRVISALIIHPGPTVGYRIECNGKSLAYLSDHEPALGLDRFPLDPEWTSGYRLAAGVDLLLHDTQYSAAEYKTHIGWGHSSLSDALKFAALTGVKHIVSFHHDPDKTDHDIDRMVAETPEVRTVPCRFTIGAEGATFEL